MELFAFIRLRSTDKEFQDAIDLLIDNKLIGLESGYYFLINGNSSILDRTKKLKISRRYLKIARFIATLIFYHPYVRSVLVSGSLSKHAYSKKDDIDFFVIAEPGRVWICRTLLMLFKKIFLLNSKKYFCINYFIDSKNLEIPEKNVFTATEIAFLVPVKNRELCKRFFEQNSWVMSFFPNLIFSLDGCKTYSHPVIKSILEKLLNGRHGDKLDTRLLEIYKKRAIKKYRKTVTGDFDINFKNQKEVAKHHPNGFQQIIMDNFNEQITEFEAVHKTDLTI
jgi:predicted nucleotidyltransferase